MPASDARISANRLNSLRSTGPRTAEGKMASRRNAMTHGLTGAGVVVAPEDSAEVDRKAAAFASELGVTGEVGAELARRMAVQAVRMDRAARQEFAAVAENVRRAEEAFEAPEGVGEAEADRLRAEAGARASFDPSKEATLARKYEAAAERGFFRALKEIRELKARAGAGATAGSPGTGAAASMVQARGSLAALGSFSPAPSPAPAPSPPARPAPVATAPAAHPTRSGPSLGAFEVPISIGLAR